jgi:hypothetical protein
MIRVIDVAWAAGFLEGEGHFSHQRAMPFIKAVQVEWGPIEKLSALFGGIVRHVNHPRGANGFVAGGVH